MSTLVVENLQGLSSGSNANTVIIPSGHNLTAPGHVVQTYVWKVSPVIVSTSGNWAAATVPTLSNTYGVASQSFTKKFSNSKVMTWCSGNVDPGGGTGGSPAIVCLIEAGGTYLGGAYRHIRVANNEPLGFNFAGEDDSSGTSKEYKLRCHCSITSLTFGRSANNNSAHTYTVMLMEIAQ